MFLFFFKESIVPFPSFPIFSRDMLPSDLLQGSTFTPCHLSLWKTRCNCRALPWSSANIVLLIILKLLKIHQRIVSHVSFGVSWQAWTLWFQLIQRKFGKSVMQFGCAWFAFGLFWHFWKGQFWPYTAVGHCQFNVVIVHSSQCMFSESSFRKINALNPQWQ